MQKAVEEANKMIKKISLSLAFLLIFSIALTGCGTDKNSGDKEKDTLSEINCITLKDGAGDKVLSNIKGKYKVKTYKNFQDVEKKVLKGSFDVVILPAGMFSKLYAKAKPNLVEVSPITLDGMYVLANGWAKNSVKLGTLRGMKINAYGEGTSSEMALIKAMKEKNLSISKIVFEYFYTEKDLEDRMKEYGAFCIAAEPYASEIEKIPGVNKVLDIGEKYRETEMTQAPSEVLAVSKKFLDKRPDDVDVLVKDFEKAVSSTKARNTKLVFYGQSNRGLAILKKFNDQVKKWLPEQFSNQKFASDFYYDK